MIKFILSEIYLGWKHDIKSCFLLIILSTMGFASCGIAFSLTNQTKAQVTEYKEIYEDIQFYTILDNFNNNSIVNLDDKNNTNKFKTFLNLLTESEFFEYFMMYDQPVYIENYIGDESNIYGYEHTSDLSGMTITLIDKNGITRESTGVKAFWIGSNVIDYFGLKLSEGRQFQQNDFILNPNNKISVILGSNYSNEYKVGDTIHISFVFSDSEAQIVGFLEEGTNIYYRNKYVNLDKYVIMPIFINDDYEGNEIYNFSVNHFYSLRNSGVLASKLSVEDVQNIIANYSINAGLEEGYYITEYDSSLKEKFDLGIDIIYFIIIVIVLLIIIGDIFSIALCVINKINRNKKYFAILMLNGCSKFKVCLLILFELLMVFIISYLITIGILYKVFSMFNFQLNHIYAVLAIGVLLYSVIISLVVIIVFFKCNLIYYIREEIEYVGSK